MDHRPDLQRRRRPDRPLMTAAPASVCAQHRMPTPDAHRSSWGDVTGGRGRGRVHRAGADRRADGGAAGRLAGRAARVRRAAGSRAPLVAAGPTLAGSAAELGAACDVVSVMVLDDAQVRAVVARAADDGATGHRHRRALHDPPRDGRGAGRRPRPRRASIVLDVPGERRVHGRRTRARWPRWWAATGPPTSGPSPCSPAGPASSCTWVRPARARAPSWPATSCTSSPSPPRARPSAWPRRPGSTSGSWPGWCATATR